MKPIQQAAEGAEFLSEMGHRIKVLKFYFILECLRSTFENILNLV